MFGNGGEGHVKGLGDICDGHVILKQHREDGAAGWVRKSGKDVVKICTHTGVLRRKQINRQPFG